MVLWSIVKAAGWKKWKKMQRREATNVAPTKEANKVYIRYLPLYKAVDNGDLEATKTFLDSDSNRDALYAVLTSDGDIALHIAVLAGHVKIVEELVRRMSEEKLTLQSKHNSTALNFAAMGGLTKIAELLVKKNKNLLTMTNFYDQIPVVVAALYGHRDLVHYLYKETPEDEFRPDNHGPILLTFCIIGEFYDIALGLIRKYPQLAIAKAVDEDTALFIMAQRPSAYPSGTQLKFWQWWIYKCIYLHPHNTFLSHSRDIERPHEGPTQQRNFANPVHQLHNKFRKIVHQFGFGEIGPHAGPTQRRNLAQNGFHQLHNGLRKVLNFLRSSKTTNGIGEIGPHAGPTQRRNLAQNGFHQLHNGLRKVLNFLGSSKTTNGIGEIGPHAGPTQRRNLAQNGFHQLHNGLRKVLNFLGSSKTTNDIHLHPHNTSLSHFGGSERPPEGPTQQRNLDKHALHQLQDIFWKGLNFLVPSVSRIYELKLKHLHAKELLTCICKEASTVEDDLENLIKKPLFEAVKRGIVEFVTEIIKHYPQAIWFKDNMERNIFFVATVERQEKVFSLIYKMGAKKNALATHWDKDENNFLHQAACLAPSKQLDRVSGATLQMQRELQWFKEVESIVQPLYKDMINHQSKTPRVLFTEQHGALVERGGQWAKETAKSCTVVAALIVTIMFSTVLTAPGGYNDEGVPTLLNQNSLIIYMISDALSLFSSTTSLLMFLGLLTSRYDEEEFLNSVPKKLIIGLFSLFFSIAAMMITFGVALFVVLWERIYWASLPIVLLASFPVTLFALLQFPLLIEIFRSTYGPGIFDKPEAIV